MINIVLILIGSVIVCLLAVNLFFTTFNFISQQSIMQTLRDVSLMNRMTMDSLTFIERMSVNINAMQTQIMQGMMQQSDEEGPDGQPRRLYGTVDGKITAPSPEELMQKIMEDPEYKKLIDSSEVNLLRNLFETNTDHTLDSGKDEDEEKETPPEDTKDAGQ